METENTTQPATADLLYGVAAIAEVLGLTARQTKHRIALGEIPTFRMGRILCATRSGLTTWFSDRTQAAARGGK